MAGGLQQHDDEYGGGMLSEINVTPLVDVMLVLLIIFMVTAPLLQQGMEVQLPAASTETMPGDDTTMIITLKEDATIFMLKTQVTTEELREKLTALAQVNPNKEIFLKADTAVPYGKVVTVMSIIRESGLSRLGVVTQPGQEEL